MRNRILFIFILSLISGLGVAADAKDMRGSGFEVSAQQQVQKAIDEWIAAVNSHNAEAVASLYEPDAVLLPTMSPKVANTPALRRAYFDVFTAKADLHGTVNEEHIRVFHHIAVNSGLYTFTFTKDGQTVEVPARFSFVYEKTHSGWMIVDHHSSRLPME